MPDVCASWAFGKLPVVAKQQIKITHIPFDRVGGPRPFYATCGGVNANAAFKLIFPGNYTEISYRYNDINHNTKKFCDKFILPVLNNINKTNKIYTIIDYIYFNSKKYRDGYINKIYFTVNKLGSNEIQLINLEVVSDLNNFYHVNYLFNNNFYQKTIDKNKTQIKDLKTTIEPNNYDRYSE